MLFMAQKEKMELLRESYYMCKTLKTFCFNNEKSNIIIEYLTFVGQRLTKYV